MNTMIAQTETSPIVNYLKEHSVRTSLIVYALHLSTSVLGYYIFTTFNTSPAVVWPPFGIALAAMLLFGYRMSIPIALSHISAILINFTSPSVVTSLATVVGYTLQPAIGTYILRRFGFDNRMEHTRDALLLIAISLVVPAVGPLITLAVQFATGSLPTSVLTSLTRAWAGGIFSIMVLTPLILTFLSRTRSSSSSSSVEKGVAFAMLIAVTYVTFWTILVKSYSFIVLYILFGVLFWIALRMGPRLVTLSIFIMTAFAIAGTLIVNPSDKTIAQQLLSDQLFVVLFAPFYLILSAVVFERQKYAVSLNLYSRDLEGALEKLSREDKMKNEFIAILAHELRNPLAPLVSSLELLKLHNTDQESGEFIDRAQKQTQVMRRLLDDLLDVTRVTQKKIQPQKGAGRSSGPNYTGCGECAVFHAGATSRVLDLTAHERCSVHSRSSAI